MPPKPSQEKESRQPVIKHFSSGVTINLDVFLDALEVDLIDQTGDPGLIIRYTTGQTLRLKGLQADEVRSYFTSMSP